MTLPELVGATDSPSHADLGETVEPNAHDSRAAVRISVIGCGYLGAVHAACMAALGHEVIGIDVDARKVEALAVGEPRFSSPNCLSC